MKYKTGLISVPASELPNLSLVNAGRLEIYMEQFERQFDQRRPVVVAETVGGLKIIDGETVLRAARRNGHAEITCFNIGVE